MLISLDSNIIIYLIENPPGWGPRSSAYVTQLLANQDEILLSDLTKLECRVKPVAQGDRVTLKQFDAFFTSPGVHVVGLTSAVCERATLIRAARGYKLGDALHLAVAVENSCDRFVTNDTRLHGFPDITVEALP